MEKHYLTKKGLERIQKEHKQLLSFREAKTRGETPAIWHSEDVNPEYLAFQEDMGLLEARVSEYEKILRSVELIRKPPKARRDEVSIGATVVFNVDEQKDTFTIVGSLETNPTEGRISNESLVGRAFMGAKVGDAVEVSSPVKVVYIIREILYEL